MIKAIIFDFSRVILFPKDNNYIGSLNGLNDELREKYGENYDFFMYFQLNKEILQKIEQLKESGLRFYIFTTDKIQDRHDVQKEISSLFAEIFRAKELGVVKNESNAYETLINVIGINKSEVIYIDDTEINIEAAKSAGLKTIRYQNNKNLFAELETYLSTD